MVSETSAAFVPDPGVPGFEARGHASRSDHDGWAYGHAGADEGLPAAGAGPWTLLTDAISDDLRSSLALVGGYRQSLELLPLDPATRERHVERLVAATGALAQIATVVLDLVRSTANPPGIARQPVSVDYLVGRLRRAVDRELPEEQIECAVAPDLPMVDVEPSWIGHALRILVEHTRQHPAAAGGVAVHAHGNASTVVLTIRTATSEEPVPARLPRPLPGRGMGGDAHLALCRQIVELNGGSLRLDETDTRCFATVSLPAFRLQGR